MITEITLTPKQHELLQLAANRFFGNTHPTAAHIGLHGAAYEIVGMKLKNLGLLEGENSSLWHLTDAAKEYFACGKNPQESESNAEQPLEVALFEAFGGIKTLAMGSAPLESATTQAQTDDNATKPHKRKMREDTKLAKVISLLQRPEGTTLSQITDATGWKMHTARAVLSRSIQKDLGIALVSEKVTASDRIYRVKA